MKALNALWLLALLLSGCAQLGIAPAKSFDDRLAYAYGTNTAIREASTSALNAKQITSEDMEHVMAVNDQARSILDAARGMKGIDPKAAEGRLVLATNLLVQLQQYLRSRQ
jgi:hypothetical protein